MEQPKVQTKPEAKDEPKARGRSASANGRSSDAQNGHSAPKESGEGARLAPRSSQKIPLRRCGTLEALFLPCLAAWLD